MQFVYFVVQISNFFSLVLYSAAIHKKRRKKLISKTIKCNFYSLSKMQFCFFHPKNIFLENYWFYKKSGSDANSRGWEGSSSFVIMTQCVQKSICDLRLSLQSAALSGRFTRFSFLLGASCNNSWIFSLAVIAVKNILTSLTSLSYWT